MNEGADYFFAVLDSRIRAGDDPMEALVASVEDYAHVFEIKPREPIEPKPPTKEARATFQRARSHIMFDSDELLIRIKGELIRVVLPTVVEPAEIQVDYATEEHTWCSVPIKEWPDHDDDKEMKEGIAL